MTITRREFRKVVGIGVACWLVGVICAGAVGYLYVQVSSQGIREAINASVCGFRALAEPQLATFKQAAKDKTLSDSARKRNDARIKSTEAFLRTQVTVPRNYRCPTVKP